VAVDSVALERAELGQVARQLFDDEAPAIRFARWGRGDDPHDNCVLLV